MRFSRPLVSLVFALTASSLTVCSCEAPSADEVRERFDDFVAGANQCTQASDCALVYPGCPLGCFAAVRADRKAAVEAKARALIDEYERGGRSCIYDCPAPGPVACVENRCSANPAP